MKKICVYCDGEGRIPCPDCHGNGTNEVSIETMKLTEDMDDFKQLSELQKDARRVIRQAGQLTAMNPARAADYDDQLTATLLQINEQAELIQKRSR